jgi:Reverse transcriptase (RNA-dependent DNA polymerase)
MEEALKLDELSKTTFWRDAIAKEMENVMPAFEFIDNNKPPIGYEKIPFHMIFDIKSDLTRKARLVAGGHMTDVPKESVYASVISSDSVRLAFMLASLNDLKVLVGNVQNAYLNAPTEERCYCIAGQEFGANNVGQPVKIVRALTDSIALEHGGGITWQLCYMNLASKTVLLTWMFTSS